MNLTFEPNCFYHFYNRGNNKDNIFIEEENFNYFLNLMKKHLLPIADVYSYCLLSNHFHFVLKIKEEKDFPEKYKSISVSRAFSNLFNAYTKAFNKKYDRTSSLFQKHPKKIRIDSLDYLQNLILYVNTNSSHHNFEDYLNYNHSSYKTLISNQPTLLKRNETIDMFDNVENFIYLCETKKIDMDNLRSMLFE